MRLALPFALRNLLGRLEIPGSIAVSQTASEPLGCVAAGIFSVPLLQLGLAVRMLLRQF